MTRRAAVITMIAACTLAATAGPAAAATAASGASAAGTPGRSAASAPGTSAVSRLLGPGARWLSFGTRPAAGERAMIAQAPAASAGFTGAVLYGVSCTGRAQCTATGLVTTRSGKNARTLAERWTGTKWVVQATPTPLSGGLLGGVLSAGVSCTSSHACVTAGYSYGKSAAKLLGEGWNGHTWTTQPLNKQPVFVIPSGIACTWARDCTTVGTRASGGTMAEHWNGKKWSVVATKKYGLLAGVTCPASRNCTATGATSTGKALAEHWNGKSWSVQPAASPDPISELLSVSCHPAGACVAVGAGGPASGATAAPLAEQWTGGKWVATSPSPVDPSPGDFAELDSVSCLSATNCMAVGDAGNAAGTTDATLAEHWDGTSWTVETTPDPAKFSSLVSVSCTSASHCVAVGADSATATGSVRPLVEVWNGSTWTEQTAPR
jgi:hypothetical protein